MTDVSDDDRELHQQLVRHANHVDDVTEAERAVLVRRIESAADAQRPARRDPHLGHLLYYLDYPHCPVVGCDGKHGPFDLVPVRAR